MDQQTASSRYAEIRKSEPDYYKALRQLMREGATIDQAAQAEADFCKQPLPVQPNPLPRGKHDHAYGYSQAQRRADRGFERHHHGDE